MSSPPKVGGALPRDRIRSVAERFVLENLDNVRSFRIAQINAALFEGAWVHRVTGVAGPGFSSARVHPVGVPVEILVARDGRVVAVQGESWQGHQRGRQLLGHSRR